jgi:hypothetical protein
MRHRGVTKRLLQPRTNCAVLCCRNIVCLARLRERTDADRQLGPEDTLNAMGASRGLLLTMRQMATNEPLCSPVVAAFGQQTGRFHSRCDRGRRCRFSRWPTDVAVCSVVPAAENRVRTRLYENSSVVAFRATRNDNGGSESATSGQTFVSCSTIDAATSGAISI